MNENEEVKLKPIFGIEPERYLLGIYSVILILILFLLFFLPGIKNPGTLYSFNTVPSGCVVYIDDNYAGATPFKFFVPKGEHIFRIEKKHFETVEKKVYTKGRLIGSFFIKKKEDFSTSLPLTDPDGFLKETFTEFASWGMIYNFYENYQPKPILGPLFKNLSDIGYSDIPTLSGFLYSAMTFIHTEELYHDFLEALIIYEEIKTGEKLEVGDDITDSFMNLSFFQDTEKFMENLPFWFYTLLKDENRTDKLNRVSALQEEYTEFLKDFSNDYPSVAAVANVNGMRFLRLTGGEFLVGADGKNFPFPASVSDMFIMDREVTNELFKLFLYDNPEWAPLNKQKLINKGLVNEDYLKDFDTSDNKCPVNFISWFAAKAFCDWVEDNLPDFLSDYTVRLPDEYQWEWAALTEPSEGGIFKDSELNMAISVEGRYPNESGLYDLKGNLWEWCENWYAPASNLLTSRNPSYNEPYYGSYDGVEKSVRGGSWANDEVSTSMRGSQPPSWCTEFLGFRPVLVRK